MTVPIFIFVGPTVCMTLNSGLHIFTGANKCNFKGASMYHNKKLLYFLLSL